MSSLSLYFVRHAPVIGQHGIAYGREAEINEQCHDLFNAAARQLPTDALWIASEFPRAQKTAKILQQTLGINRNIEIDPAFNEQDFGHLVGQKKHAIFKDPANKSYLADMSQTAPPGGESVPQMTIRVRNGLQGLIDRMRTIGEGNAVVVCHGGVIRSVASIAGGQPFDISLKVPYLSVHSIDTSAFHL